jgi:hypothetical protein
MCLLICLWILNVKVYCEIITIFGDSDFMKLGTNERWFTIINDLIEQVLKYKTNTIPILMHQMRISNNQVEYESNVSLFYYF